MVTTQSVESPLALEVAGFWLDAGSQRWFSQSDSFDSACGAYRDAYEQAKRGDLAAWQRTAVGSFALLVLLDQLPRNLFRGTAQQFATDAMALQVSEHAISAGHDRVFTMPARNIFYLPFQHSENLAVQERSLDLYRRAGDQNTYYYALIHYDAIRRFGRFPHRNAVLGRETSEAERAYMASGGFMNSP